MSSNDRLIETIEHYKRNIIRACPDNEQVTDPKKVVYCLEKLSKLPISVSLLSVTGIGRTVNELRKFEGPISEKAKVLVTSWKAVVKAEEDSTPLQEGSDVEEQGAVEVNGHDHNAKDSVSENGNTSDDEATAGTHNELSDEDDLDKENEIEEDSESEDEKEKRLKFEEEKRAYEEYLKAKKKKTLNGNHKNGEHKEERGNEGRRSENKERRKSDERRKDKEHRAENGREKHTSDKHDKDKDKFKSSSDKHSSRDTVDKRSRIRSKSSDNHRDSKYSKSSSKDTKTNSIDQFSEEIRIKTEKIDDGYEKALDKRNGDTSEGKDKHRNGEYRDNSSKDDKKQSSKRRDKDESKRKHERERDRERSSHKKSRSDVVVKQEPVTSDDESNREESSSRESSVSATGSSVKKEKTEYSSQSHGEKGKRNNSRDSRHSASEPKKMKLVEASDGGFADALMSIVPGKKSSKKKSPSSSKKSTEQTSSQSPSKSSRSGSTTRSPSVHSSGSISPLDLLSGNVKLEPLEKLDIASTLPEISPDNYFKPHLYQSSEKSSPVASHEDLCSIMTSKNQRTKVFSGSRVSLAKVPSLYDSCIRILQENIDSLEYTGGVPYDILKPVLERCTAEQLYQLEHYNPYLMEETGPHWQFHCNRDFRGQKLQEYETWRELYLRCMLEREKKLKEVRNTIAQSKKQSLPVRTTKLAYVDSSFVKPPRQVARQQAKHGTGSSTSSSSSSSHMNKAEVVAKASVGAFSTSAVIGGPAVPVTSVKPGNTGVSAAANNPLMKKKKAPLMMKALQSFKGFRRK